jgi:squalene-hopene/tetraprenyl-beta-curcumene cyclase
MFQNEDSQNIAVLKKTAKRSKAGVLERVLEGLEAARVHAYSTQIEDGHWCGELESNCTINAEYIFMRQALGLDLASRREGLIKSFSHHQKTDGSWGIAFNYPGDVSTTAEVYLAMRILGVPEADARLKKAETFILKSGGLEKVRIFTRINFAIFGLVPWESVPVVPPEFILASKEAPINIYRIASWARSTMVPLFIIFHHRPCFALPNGKSTSNDWLDHLWHDPSKKTTFFVWNTLAIVKEHGIAWRSLFALSDGFLRAYEKFKPKAVRELAVKKCQEWVLERQEESGDWAGIFPPMVNSVLALHLQGFSLTDGPLKKGLEAIERFALEDERGFQIQACVSPTWDTVLSVIGVIDSHPEEEAFRADPRLIKACKWVLKHQIFVDYGDWKVYNPKGPSGGWAFEYENKWYPDVDDTAAVLLCLLKQDPASRNTKEVLRAFDWMMSMQNEDGGWAAFDVGNNKRYINEIPFSDMDSLCDESCPDVTGRVLEALGILNNKKYKTHAQKGIEYLRTNQEKEGSWYGRWGVNYIYGTSHALCGLARQGVPANDPMIERGLAWLQKVQNSDGGWGECLESYKHKRLMGVGDSAASQTAWSLMGLIAYSKPDTEVWASSIEPGVRWLMDRQKNGTWEEVEFTGTGFPRHFYLRYHMYRHYFPMMALGRYSRLRQNG